MTGNGESAPVNEGIVALDTSVSLKESGFTMDGTICEVGTTECEVPHIFEAKSYL